MPGDMFVSYSVQDAAEVDRLLEAVERESVRCWIAPRDIPPGAVWPAAIVAAIESCPVFLLVLSRHSVQSRQVLNEVTLAVSAGATLIPYRLEEVTIPDALRYHLGPSQFLDGFRDPSSAISPLVSRVRGLPVTSGEAGKAPARAAKREVSDWIIRVIEPDGSVGHTAAIHFHTPLTIGRTDDAGIQLPGTDKLVSRLHAKISIEAGSPVIADCESKNGIFVNGNRISRAVLSSGDVVQIGSTSLRVDRYDATETAGGNR